MVLYMGLSSHVAVSAYTPKYVAHCSIVFYVSIHIVSVNVNLYSTLGKYLVLSMEPYIDIYLFNAFLQ